LPDYFLTGPSLVVFRAAGDLEAETTLEGAEGLGDLDGSYFTSTAFGVSS